MNTLIIRSLVGLAVLAIIAAGALLWFRRISGGEAGALIAIATGTVGTLGGVLNGQGKHKEEDGNP